MNKLTKEKRDKIILVAMLTAIAVGVLWFLLISSQRKSIESVRSEVTMAQDQLSRGQATLKSRAQVQQQFEEASQSLKGREATMAAPNDMYSWLIATLNNFRMKYKVEIPQFGRELPADVGIFAKFPYKAALFNIRGSAYYHDYGKFLADFENAFPYIRVQNIEMDPAIDTSGRDVSEKLSFKMELLTLVRPTSP